MMEVNSEWPSIPCRRKPMEQYTLQLLYFGFLLLLALISRIAPSIVWCGVVWCGVVWCGVVWCGVVWCGVVWCGVVWCGVVWMSGSIKPFTWFGSGGLLKQFAYELI